MANGLIIVEVEGLRELERALAQLPREVGKRALDGALKDGAEPIVDDAERRAPVLKEPDPRREPGVLRRAIRAVALRRPLPGMSATVQVLPKSRGRGPDDPWYWKLVEYGTSKMAAIPFLRPAFEAMKYAALERIRIRLKLSIERAAERLAWRRR